jgi:selenium donor protein
VDVGEMGVDLLSIAGHKLYAPKGIGALFIREGLTLPKLIHGADHEMNLRAGTENVLEIVGLGKACEIAAKNLEKSTVHLKSVTEALHEGLKSRIPSIKMNGHPIHRLPNTLSISFPGVEANTLLSELSQVAASAGAACHTDRIDVSSVLQAMKIPQEYAMGTIRFSTGKYTTMAEIGRAIDYIATAVKKLKNEETNGRGGEVTENIRLTQYTHGLGCACKIRPQYLEKILKDFPLPVDPNILVSLNASDDAAVYKINEETAIIQTVDFFTPIIDDPYHFGAIAAANAMSDIYAMGGKPVFALNIVGFPDSRLPMDVLKSILKGALDKTNEAGVHILGGHTIEDTEPKFGMTVTGFAHPEKIITNSGLRPGDALVLTKPIGLGIISTAIKRGLASREMIDEAILIMTELNKTSAEIMAKYPVSACTDITGFGLLGHLKEMTVASQADVEIYPDSIPVINGVDELIAGNIVPGGTVNNLDFVSGNVVWGAGITHAKKIILCDAQTSGGLLIALPWDQRKEIIKEVKDHGIYAASCIGKCVSKGVGKILLQGL